MKMLSKILCGLLFGSVLSHAPVFAQTEGNARLEVTLLDYNGSGTKHWTVAWITTQSGTFIKTLRKQGPSWTSTHWDSHCSTWNTARGGSSKGSQALDGYSSATAQNYTGTNSPIVLSWNGKDANNQLMADGNYKFWVQYAEDSGQGPTTTSGLLWTKGPSGGTNTYANQGAYFTSMKVAWAPSAPPTVAPTLTSAAPTASGTLGVPYQFTCTATGTAPLSYTASGLPEGLSISSDGIISGRPTLANTFSGTISVSNGTLPNATQNFAISIDAVPMQFTSIQAGEGHLLISGRGAANGMSYLHATTDINLGAAQWTRIATNYFDASGNFTCTNALSPTQEFYRLQFP
jgi:hypothetical protein